MIASKSIACATARLTRTSPNGLLGSSAFKARNRLLLVGSDATLTPGVRSKSATWAGGTASIQSTAPVLNAATRVVSSGMILIVSRRMPGNESGSQ